jgi:hypothetical protein
MAGRGSITFTIAVEGTLDEAVVRKILTSAGHETGRVHGLQGCAHLDRHLSGYNVAAQFMPWIVLRDLDNHPCAAILARELRPAPAAQMIFRIAIREVESWILADRAACASFLGVSSQTLPSDPESLADPKEALIACARRSRRREIREDLVPRPESGRRVGPAYAARLKEFVENSWNPARAAKVAASLASLSRKIDSYLENFPRKDH